MEFGKCDQLWDKFLHIFKLGRRAEGLDLIADTVDCLLINKQFKEVENIISCGMSRLTDENGKINTQISPVSAQLLILALMHPWREEKELKNIRVKLIKWIEYTAPDEKTAKGWLEGLRDE